MSEESVLENLAKAVQDRNVSWLQGEVKVLPSMMTLFVKGHGEFEFPYPAAAKLEALYNTSEPASFGKGAQTVFDETYRKGRALATDRFAINLRPQHSLLEQIKHGMIDGGQHANSFVRAELYRVNVYGPGDFFKEHKDTPQQAPGHFGSLMFCLPTTFEGGAFGLRSPQGEEVKFDWGSQYGSATVSAAADDGASVAIPTAESADCAVSFIAFARDLDHWVEPVISGHRVTLTFHLFREDAAGADHVTQPIIDQLCDSEAVKAARALAASKIVSGTNIVYPLVHSYQVEANVVLKGGDASLFHMLKRLGVRPRVMWYYDRHLYEHDDDDDEDESECEDDIDDDEDGSECEDDGSEGESHDDRAPRKRAKAIELPLEKCYLTDVVEAISEVGFYECDGERAIDEIAGRYHVYWARTPKTDSQLLTAVGHYGNDCSIRGYGCNACILTTW
jgi:hypothetical protein